MNFLAHLTLSCQDEALQMGNLLGDYTKGKPPAHYPTGVLRGLEIHRLIDRTTDAHPAVRQLNATLKSRHGRYAGVVSDVIFDLYLYRNWALFGPAHFDEFAEATYASLQRFLPLLKPDLSRRIGSMIEHRWLNTYRSSEGILSVFHRMKPRLSKPQWLEGVDLTMREMDEAFNECFLQLFPDLILTVNNACGCE
jgi:acyl carrier protein phosphodiesterase